ncbi:MAG: hypothetical protein IH600_08675 [Bacteroidetes bacterium]|nr:hypothetical protein [Bacteroidota bacterium]
MKKVVLPLSERFTVHATALINKVHHERQRKLRDVQMDTIMLARNMNFSLRQADEKTLQQRVSL